MNDIDRQDADDRLMDRNLRAAARHLELPETPTPLQRARWKQGAMAPASTAPKKGILGMKPQNFWRVIGTGGALAACITVAVIFGFGGAKTVKAAAIFDSLREAIRKSLWIEIDGVTKDGVTADGRVLLVFDDADHAATVGENDLNDGIAASYVELRINAVANHPEFPGLDLEAAFGVKPGDGWGFVKTHHIPAILFVEQPMLGFFAPMLNNGIVVDLDALGVGSPTSQAVVPGPGGGPSAAFHFSTSGQHSSDEEVDPDAEGDGEEVTTVLKFSFSTTGETEGDGDANANATDDGAGDATVESVNENFHRVMFGSFHHDVANSSVVDAAMEEHVQMVEDFLTGRFTPEQMDAFIDHVEQSASETTVTPNADGSYLLRASGFDFGGHSDADDDLVLELTYRGEAGIERVELLNLGDGPGTLRFIFSDADETAEVFDRTRYSAREGVRTIDSVGGLFGGSPE